MRFYGIGVKWGRVDDKFPDFQKYGFWCMGYWPNEKPDYYEMIQSIHTGDVVFAKAYSPEHPKKFYIRAIGFVSDRKKPDIIPEEYHNKSGFSVKWTTIFDLPLILEPDTFFMPDGFMKNVGNLRTHTIYQENENDMILKIVRMMCGPYGERREKHVL